MRSNTSGVRILSLKLCLIGDDLITTYKKRRLNVEGEALRKDLFITIAVLTSFLLAASIC